MPSDIEIAQAAKMQRIAAVAREKLGISEEHLEPYGHYKAKVSLKYLDTLKGKKDGKLILVTAISPITAGEVVGSVGEKQLLDALFKGTAALADALERHMAPPLPIIGSGESVTEAVAALSTADALLVHVDGKPAGVITRQDLLGHLAGSGS